MMIEILENRRMLSVSVPAVAVKAPRPLVTYSHASPGKILAGNKLETEVVTVHNYTTAPVTESVSVTLTPSLDGVTPAAFTTTVNDTVTIRKHGAVAIKVPYVPPITLAAGKYHTLLSVDVAGDIVTGVAPGTYTLTLPPFATTTPSLVGDYSGLITSTSTQGTGLFDTGTVTHIEKATFIWQTSSQDLTSLTGLFAVGSGQTVGSMEGYELSNGVIHYTLTSANINYTIDGKVSANGETITGKFKGTLVNNIFTGLAGTFKIISET